MRANAADVLVEIDDSAEREVEARRAATDRFDAPPVEAVIDEALHKELGLLSGWSEWIDHFKAQGIAFDS